MNGQQRQNDPDFGRMWGLQNTGQQVNGVTGLADADIDADLAWDLYTGSSTVKVAIVDSGVDYLHPDLAANVWTNSGEISGNGIDDDVNGYVDDVHGYDFGSGDGDPMDFVGHGTHVAGTVGAVGNNGIGTVGVNWNSSLMALKIGTDLGGPTNAGAIAAINYAVAMGAVVSNHSYTVNPTAALQTAIFNAQANGHIVVVAAGNSASNNDFSPVYPASYSQDNVVTVAATDQSDALATFSNYGAFSVDIGAPGVNIWSTTPRAGSLFYRPNYDFSDGTSMAAPAVTGAISFFEGFLRLQVTLKSLMSFTGELTYYRPLLVVFQLGPGLIWSGRLSCLVQPLSLSPLRRLRKRLVSMLLQLPSGETHSRLVQIWLSAWLLTTPQKWTFPHSPPEARSHSSWSAADYITHRYT